MALSTGTLSFDLADLLGVDFDARRTKVTLTTNVPGDTLVDTAANKIRLGGGKVTVNADGTGSAAVWLPGADGNPTSWQTYVHVDYPDTGSRERRVRTFGPFTINATADLADLIAEQEVPPTYLSTITTLLDGYVDQAEAAAAQAVAEQLPAAIGEAFPGLLLAPAPTVVSTFLGDDFVSGAGATLNGRVAALGSFSSTWQVISGAFQTTGGSAFASGTPVDGAHAVMPGPRGASYSVELTAAATSGSGADRQSPCVDFAYADTENFWFIVIDDVENAVSLYEVADAELILRHREPADLSNGGAATVRADVWGSDITLVLNGQDRRTVRGPSVRNGNQIGIRLGLVGTTAAPARFERLRYTNYQGRRLNWPRLVPNGADPVVPLGAPGSWDDTDANNPNVLYDPVNRLWLLTYTGYGGGAFVQGLGVYTAPSLDGPWTEWPDNPIFFTDDYPTTAENGGLVYVDGLWLHAFSDGGSGVAFSTTPDLLKPGGPDHTILSTKVEPAYDAFLRVREDGVTVELYYGLGFPNAHVYRKISTDIGRTWIDDPTFDLAPPTWATAFGGHAEPTVIVPPGREGQEYVVFADVVMADPDQRQIACGISIDAGATWTWRLVDINGAAWDARQTFDSYPVYDNGRLHMFYGGAPVDGLVLSIDIQIGHVSVEWQPAARTLRADPTPAAPVATADPFPATFAATF